MDDDERYQASEPQLSDAPPTHVIYGAHHLAIHADGLTSILDEAISPPLLEPRILAETPPSDEAEPLGRDAVVNHVVALIRQLTSVQLYGPRGIGRRTVARAVLRKLDVWAGPTATVYGDDQGLDELAQAVFEALFNVVNFRPDASALRPLAIDARALVVIEDCDLGVADTDRLLDLFPECIFLLISLEETLDRAGVAVAIEPLSEDDGFQLVDAWIGPVPPDFGVAVMREGCRQAAGVPQRLLMYAAFTQSLLARPSASASPRLPPIGQAAALIAGLSDPARRVLSAMADVGTGVDPSCFAALAGSSLAADTAAELEASRLVVRHGDGYRPTGDALTALAGRPAETAMTATGFGALVSGLLAADAVPSPRLVRALVRIAVTVGADGAACRLARASGPWLLAACHIEVWGDVIADAAVAARRSATGVDAAFVVHEDAVRAVIVPDRMAVVPTVVFGAVRTVRRTWPPAQTRPRDNSAGRRVAVVAIGAAVIVAAVAFASISLMHNRSTPTAAVTAGSTGLPPTLPTAGQTVGQTTDPVSPHQSPTTTQSTVKPSTPATAPPATTPPSPSVSPSRRPSPSPSSSPVLSPTAVISAYFSAINRHDYRAAWNLGGDNLGGTYDEYVAGFANTAKDVATVISVEGEIVQINLAARQTDGSTLHFSGPVTVQNGVIIAASLTPV